MKRTIITLAMIATALAVVGNVSAQNRRGISVNAGSGNDRVDLGNIKDGTSNTMMNNQPSRRKAGEHGSLSTGFKTMSGMDSETEAIEFKSGKPGVFWGELPPDRSNSLGLKAGSSEVLMESFSNQRRSSQFEASDVLTRKKGVAAGDVNGDAVPDITSIQTTRPPAVIRDGKLTHEEYLDCQLQYCSSDSWTGTSKNSQSGQFAGRLDHAQVKHRRSVQGNFIGTNATGKGLVADPCISARRCR
jgi:hypothetical protein